MPWAWGINGTASVVAAIAAALLTLTFGFSTVLAIGGAAYGAATLLVVVADRSPIGADEGDEHH